MKRALGKTGLELAPLVFGGNVFGWTVDEATSFTLLDAFVGAGFSMVDTADVYSRWVPGHQGGESEVIIGRWLKARGQRDRVLIATKAGMDMGEGRKGLRKEHILRAAEDSLRRLQTDRIDLYQAHADDPDAPQDEALEAFATLMRQGKVRAVGASNFTADRLASALAISREKGLPAYQCLQPLYNLYDRADFEDALAPLCQREGLGVIPYYSLASGFLTGKYRDAADLRKGARGPRVEKYWNERGFRIVDALRDAARELEATPAQVALAWLMAKPAVTAPIASATSLSQLTEIMGATQVAVTPALIARLDEASA